MPEHACFYRGRSRVQERDKEPLQERFFRPHFLQAPGDMVAHEGRLCRLDCKVDSNSHPWFQICSHFAFVRLHLLLFVFVLCLFFVLGWFLFCFGTGGLGKGDRSLLFSKGFYRAFNTRQKNFMKFLNLYILIRFHWEKNYIGIVSS